MPRVPRNGFALILLSLALPVAASADPVVVLVTSGQILSRPESSLLSHLDLIGTNGFTFVARTDSGNANLCRPCPAGVPISLSATISPTFFGEGSLAGRSYDFDFNNGGGTFGISTPFSLPTVTGSTAFIETTFDLLPAMSFLVFQRGTDAQHVSLMGSGIARATYGVFNDPFHGELYTLHTLQFDFRDPASAPVPEPGSLLLLGGGIASLLLRRRARAAA